MKSYAINRKAVVSEQFDHEAVLVHLETGNYYSLGGSAVAIWSALEHGLSGAPLADLFAAQAVDPPDARQRIALFVEALAAEGLILESDGPPPPTNGFTPPPGPFEPPALEKFGDMADLIQLDPIHDVDEAGWPKRPVH